MVLLVTFKTAKFDPSVEPENDINPIAGQSVLAWLKKSILSGEYETTDPAPEDWGWYIDLAAGDRRYMIGAICYWEPGESVSGPLEWLLQFHKSRSLKEKILGRAKIDENDPVFLRVLTELQEHDDFDEVKWEANA